MISLHEIKINTHNKKILNIVNDNKISIGTLDNDSVFEYQNNGRSYKIIIVHFKYNDKIVSQAFYQCQDEFNGTWLPFDGIKANVNDTNVFYQYLDTEPFNSDLYPFGNEKLMCVSYIIGGGVWINKETKYRKILNVNERISYLANFKTVKVEFNNSLYINHFINYSISRNYYDNHPTKSFNFKSPKWVSSNKEVKNEQRLFSAFDFSAKMNNSYQIEYTPPLFANKICREDYNDFYLIMDNCEVKEKIQDARLCTIL